MNRKHPALRDTSKTLLFLDTTEPLRKLGKKFSKKQITDFKGVRGRSPLVDMTGFDII